MVRSSGLSTELLDQLEQTLDNSPEEVRVASTLNQGKQVVTPVRVSHIKWIRPNENNEWIFNFMNGLIDEVNSTYFGFNLNGYDSFQYTSYLGDEEGHYGWHMDMHLTNNVDLFRYGVRKLSMSFLVNNGYEGGHFELNTGTQESPVRIQAKRGDAIFFPSYMCHRVTPVIDGTRKSLVVWVLGPKFV